MRLLLLSISSIFSFIFYSFYSLDTGKTIFGGQNFLYQTGLQSISGNLLFESGIFLLIAIYLFIYFSPNSSVQYFKQSQKSKIYYVFFYLFLFFLLLIPGTKLDFYLVATLLFFIFGDISFSILSNLKIFESQKASLRYFGLVLNYISSFLSLSYLFSGEDFSAYLLLILGFNMVFNFLIHRKYTNYISLGVSIIIFLFFLYYLYIKLLYLVNNFLYS